MIIIFLILLIAAIVNYFLGFEIALIVIISSFMALYFKINYKKIKREQYYSDVSTNLPYLLRHMSTEIRAGKGLHDVFISLSKAEYGSLSNEFLRVSEEIKYGGNTEKSLIRMSKRVQSKNLTRAVEQITRTLKSGGNLSNTLNIISEDVFQETSLKLKEYSEKLNVFVMLYMFIAILAPVLILTLITAASMVLGDFISGDLVIILYLLFFPLIICFLLVLLRKLEPRI